MKLRNKIVLLLILTLLISNISLALSLTDGQKLKDLGLVSGNENGDLMEDQHLNRAQLAKVLCQLNNVIDEANAFQGNMGFIDVPKDQWYATYVNYCRNNSWLKGITETEFDPDGSVTEEMLATVLLRVLNYNPTWGEATSNAKEMNLIVPINNQNQITRGETFSYIYQSLNQNLNTSDKTLRQHIGVATTEIVSKEIVNDNNKAIEIAESVNFAGSFYDRNTDSYKFLNHLGNPVEVKDVKHESKVSNYILKSDKYYYLIKKDGSLLTEKAFNYYFTYLDSEFPINLADRHILLTDTEYIVLDNNYNVVTEDNYTKNNDYEIIDGTDKFLILSKDPENNNTSELIADFKGSIMKDVSSTDFPDNCYFNYDILNNKFVTVKYRDSSAPKHTTTNFIMNAIYGTRLTQEEENSEINLIDKNTFTIQTNHYIVDKEYLNYDTGESSQLLNHNKKYKDLIWHLGDDYGLIRCDSPDHSSYLYNAVGKEMEPLFNEDYQKLSYMGDGIFSFKKSGYYGLIDANGKILEKPMHNLIEKINGVFVLHYKEGYGLYSNKAKAMTSNIYNRFTYSIKHGVFFMIYNNTCIVYNTNIKKVPGFSYYDKDTKLSNNFILVKNMLYGKRGVQDISGNELVPIAYKTIYYSNGLNLFIGDSYVRGNYDVYNSKGSIINIFDGYEDLYTIGDNFVGAHKDNKTYILKGDGKVLYGPFEGSITFNVVD